MKTRITDLLGIENPILCAGMGFVAVPELVAAVSSAGGLGLLATATLNPLEVRDSVREIRKRTSIAVNLKVAGIDPSTPALFDFPFLVWQGDTGFPALPAAAITHLRQHLTMGGTLLVDVSDAQPEGPFAQAVGRALARVFPDQDRVRIPLDHVLYKSFYLLDRHGGRVPVQPFLEGIFVQERLAVIIAFNDLAGAIPTKRLKPSKHQAPSGIEPTEPKQRGRNHDFKV